MAELSMTAADSFDGPACDASRLKASRTFGIPAILVRAPYGWLTSACIGSALKGLVPSKDEPAVE